MCGVNQLCLFCGTLSTFLQPGKLTVYEFDIDNSESYVRSFSFRAILLFPTSSDTIPFRA